MTWSCDTIEVDSDGASVSNNLVGCLTTLTDVGCSCCSHDEVVHPCAVETDGGSVGPSTVPWLDVDHDSLNPGRPKVYALDPAHTDCTAAGWFHCGYGSGCAPHVDA